MSPTDKASSRDQPTAGGEPILPDPADGVAFGADPVMWAAGLAYLATVQPQPLHGCGTPRPEGVTNEEGYFAQAAYERSTGATVLGVGITNALGAAAAVRKARAAASAPTSGAADEHPEYWHTRGIGSEWNLTCLVTGEQRDLMPNISGFVRSREAGERVVALFGGRARLDFRPSEPNWIQVKVGAVEQHKNVLGRLGAAAYACGGMIDAQVIAWAIDPEGKPGFQPRGLRAVDELQVKLEQLKAERDDLQRHRAASEAPGWIYQGPHSVGGHVSDAVVAGRVRMLMRTDLDHEAVCVMARDRIRDLSREVACLRWLVEAQDTPARTLPRLTAFEIDVLAERRRQVEQEGWSAEHDDSYESGELASAAACYAHHASMPDNLRAGYERKGPTRDWPLDRAFWKPTDRRRDALKATAFLLAFGDSIDRAEGDY